MSENKKSTYLEDPILEAYLLRASNDHALRGLVRHTYYNLSIEQSEGRRMSVQKRSINYARGLRLRHPIEVIQQAWRLLETFVERYPNRREQYRQRVPGEIRIQDAKNGELDISFDENIFAQVAKGFSPDVVRFAKRHLRSAYGSDHSVANCRPSTTGGGRPPGISPIPRRGFLQELDALLEKYYEET